METLHLNRAAMAIASPLPAPIAISEVLVVEVTGAAEPLLSVELAVEHLVVPT